MSDQSVFRFVILVGVIISAYFTYRIDVHPAAGGDIELFLYLYVLSPYWSMFKFTNKIKYNLLDLIVILMIISSGLILLWISLSYFSDATFVFLISAPIIQFAFLIAFNFFRNFCKVRSESP